MRRPNGITLIEIVIAVGLTLVLGAAIAKAIGFLFHAQTGVEVSAALNQLRWQAASHFIDEGALSATKSHPDNQETIGSFTGSHSVRSGAVTVANANGGIYFSKAGTLFSAEGGPCNGSQCAIRVDVTFVPLCPVGIPPCVTDLARIQFSLTFLRESDRRIGWSSLLHASDLPPFRARRSICGGGRAMARSLITPSECVSPDSSALHSDSCNVWGCAGAAADGTVTCPTIAGVHLVRLSDNPTYEGCYVVE